VNTVGNVKEDTQMMIIKRFLRNQEPHQMDTMPEYKADDLLLALQYYDNHVVYPVVMETPSGQLFVDVTLRAIPDVNQIFVRWPQRKTFELYPLNVFGTEFRFGERGELFKLRMAPVDFIARFNEVKALTHGL